MSSSLVELPAKQPALWISINCTLKNPATLAGKSIFLCFFEKNIYIYQDPMRRICPLLHIFLQHPIGLFVTCHWCFGLKNGILGSENWFPVSNNWPTDPTESWGNYIETISLHLFAQVKPLNEVAFSTSSFFRFVKNLAVGFTYSVTAGTICSRASSTSTKTQTCRHEVTTNYHFVS